MKRWNRYTCLICSIWFGGILVAQSPKESKPTEQGNDSLKRIDEYQDLICRSVSRLVELQEADGAWPYEGVYRVGGKIPVGYRVGGTAIVCTSLLYSPNTNQKEVDLAIVQGTELILKELNDPLMKPSKSNRYDVRVWGHIYALDYFCRLAATRRYDQLVEHITPWIPKLVDSLITEEIDSGGWNYATRRAHACFVTAPAIQALLLARQYSVEVPDELFKRNAQLLKKSRTQDGAFQYSGTIDDRGRMAKLPGSIARSAICETTLTLLGEGDADHLHASINAFHIHWDELEKRRKKTGTHMPPYNVAPYYFYYGHRYLAQAIAFLPHDKREDEVKKYRNVIMKTKDEDHTWNDRVFPRSKAFGTAMSILSLQTDVPRPPSLDNL